MSQRRDLTKSMDVLFPQVTKAWREVEGRERMVYHTDDSTCRVCGEAVVDGRWNYCSERCRRIAKAVQRMFIWDEVRERVLDRDDYTCQECGLSKEMQWRAYWQTQEMTIDYVGQPGTVLPEDVVVEAPSSGFFHVDHIQRLADDGHPFDEANLQTLCKHCHHAKTAAENRSTEDDPAERPEVELEEYL